MNKRIKINIVHMLYCLCRIFPVKNNRIVFSSFDCRKFGGIPREISDFLNSDFEKIWILDDDVEVNVPSDVKRVRPHSLMKIYYYSTAKVWVDSHHFGNRWKRSNQYLIQTWHAAIPIKKIEGGCVEYFDPEHLKDVKKCSEMTDLQISNSDIATSVLRDGMWYYGPVLQVGMPTNDILVNISKKNRDCIKKELCLDASFKYILYAPTCRQDDSLDLVDALDYDQVVAAFEKRFSGKWKFLYRGHPIADQNKKGKIHNENVIDVTSYQKVNELLAIADSVITDYSSTISDFLVTERPGFFFAYDYDDYKSRRDFYIPLNQWPFPLAKNNMELVSNILEFDDVKFKENVTKFKNEINMRETGTSTQSVCDYIMKVCV